MPLQQGEIRKGQKFKKAGAVNIWVVLGPRPRHENEWYLARETGGKIKSILERDLESDWTQVLDDACMRP